MSTLHLTVGAVARRTGLTVRTLHHYDAIGLVQPRARTEAGYRLYSAQDIERLHAVLSLKQLGLGLEAIAAALAGEGPSPQALIGQQIAQAQRLMEQARELKDQLQLLQDTLRHNGQEADHTDALLEGMRLLSTYRRFLPARGISRLLARWRSAQSRWAPLAEALAECQRQAAPVETPQVQRLAQQWMNVAMAVFGGQIATVLQWPAMHRQAPETARHAGLDPALLAYLERAIGVRMAALQRHLSAEELARLDGSLGPEWERFTQEGERLMAAGTLPDAPQARALHERYQDLLARTVRHDAVLARKMHQAYANEPLLAHGHFVSPALREYLAQVGA